MILFLKINDNNSDSVSSTREKFYLNTKPSFTAHCITTKNIFKFKQSDLAAKLDPQKAITHLVEYSPTACHLNLHRLITCHAVLLKSLPKN